MINNTFFRTSFCFIIFVSSICLRAQETKRSYNIMTSKSASEIEDFLKDADPNDSRIFFLKNRLASLKRNSPEEVNYSKLKPTSYSAVAEKKEMSEKEEFEFLMTEKNEDKTEKNAKAVKKLNTLFDEDKNNPEAVVFVENKTSCNMILRILGEKKHNLAVPANKENSIVLPKGKYSLTSNICGIKYESTKDFSKSQRITLTNSK